MEEHRLIDAVAAQLLPKPPRRIGVAVSGGGDSVALLALVTAFARDHDIEVHVITVDHGLRANTQTEIRLVTDLCAQFGCAHHVEYWSGWDGGGNLQDRARAARYELIADWAQGNEISVVMLGHTANDQAETLMMRLSRGAGVDGLSAMTARSVRSGITWVRPLLNVQRRDLRHFLQRQDLQWIEDPSNEDRDFERIRMRDALNLLEPLGFSVSNLTKVAENMAHARTALNWQTFLIARDLVSIERGTVRIAMDGYRVLPTEISRRLLVHSLMWLSGSEYPPRRAAVEQAQLAIRESTGTTLAGCQIVRDGNAFWVFREYNAVRSESVNVGDVWDNRWYVEGPEDDPALRVSALGADGLAQIDDWRALGLPRAAILSTPAVFEGNTLIAAPVARDEEEWQAELDGGDEGFFAALLSH